MKRILNGIFKENPVFVLMLGLCSTLAITTNFESSYMMGICVLIVLILTSIIVSLLRKIVPDNVKTPVYIVIIASFVTILEMLLKKFIEPLYNVLGIYLPLIVVNCIILGRSISVYSKENVKASILDAIGIGLGYTFSLCLIGFLRELLGNGTITLINNLSSIFNFKLIIRVIPDIKILPNSIFISPTGSFLIVGIVLSVINFIKERNN